MNTSIRQLLLGAALGLAVTFMVAYLLQTTFFAEKDNPSSIAPSTSPKNISAITRAEQLDYNGKYQEAANELESYIQSNPPAEEAQKASLKLASAYYNAKDYDKAILWYEKVGKESKSYKLASLHGLAHTYRAKGDTQRAIDYFRQAIDFLKSTKPQGADLLIAADEQTIKILEQK